MKSKLKNMLSYLIIPFAAFQLSCTSIKPSKPIEETSLETKITKLLKLYEVHKTKDFRYKVDSEIPKDVTETEVIINGQAVKIRIPGFESFSCNKCHSAKDITKSISDKIKKGITLIKEHYDENLNEKTVIPKEVNIRPFLDKYTSLPKDSFADTNIEIKAINIHPFTLIFEKLFLNDSITAHEMIHISQTIGYFLHESEPYFINATQNLVYAVENPFMNPFKNIIANFFDLKILKYFEEIKQTPLANKRLINNLEEEIAFKYTKKINSETDKKVKQILKELKPLFIEALKERRANKLEWDFLFRSYGMETICIDVIATKNYKPITKIKSQKLEQGIKTLSGIYEQYDFIHRSFPSFCLSIGFSGNFREISKKILEEKNFSYEEFLNVYFTYLKKEFITEKNKINYKKIKEKVKQNPQFIDEKVFFLEQQLQKPWLDEKGRKRINYELQKLEKLIPLGYKRIIEDPYIE